MSLPFSSIVHVPTKGRDRDPLYRHVLDSIVPDGTGHMMETIIAIESAEKFIFPGFEFAARVSDGHLDKADLAKALTSAALPPIFWVEARLSPYESVGLVMAMDVKRAIGVISPFVMRARMLGTFRVPMNFDPDLGFYTERGPVGDTGELPVLIVALSKVLHADPEIVTRDLYTPIKAHDVRGRKQYPHVEIKPGVIDVVRKKYVGERIAAAIEREAKRLHEVRAHRRVYPSGKIALVRSHLRGDPAKGIIEKPHYVVRPKQDPKPDIN